MSRERGGWVTFRRRATGETLKAWLYDQTPFYFFVFQARWLDFLPPSAPMSSIVIIHRGETLTFGSHFDLATIRPEEELLVFAGDEHEFSIAQLRPLLSKGYTYDNVLRALRATNSNMEAAISVLNDRQRPSYHRQRFLETPRSLNYYYADEVIAATIKLLLDPEHVWSLLWERFQQDFDLLDPDQRAKAESSLYNAQTVIESGAKFVDKPWKVDESELTEEMRVIHCKSLLAKAKSFIRNGNTDDPDFQAALPFLKQAADMGDADSQFLYALTLSFNDHYSKSAECKLYLKKAADNGHIEAAYRYAEKLRKEAPDRNLDEYLRYYQQAAEKGCAPAQARYGALLMRFPDPECHTLGVQYIRMAADQGDLVGLAAYAGCLTCGDGVPVNLTEAERLLRLGVEKGHKGMMVLLGKLLMRCPATEDEGMRWLKLSADRGHPQGTLLYAKFCLELNRDQEAALKMLHNLAGLGYTDAVTLLAVWYSQSSDPGQATHFQNVIDEIIPQFPPFDSPEVAALRARAVDGDVSALLEFGKIVKFSDSVSEIEFADATVFLMSFLKQTPVTKYLIGICLTRSPVKENQDLALQMMKEADTEENHDMLVKVFSSFPVYGTVLKDRIPLDSVLQEHRRLYMRNVFRS